MNTVYTLHIISGLIVQHWNPAVRSTVLMNSTIIRDLRRDRIIKPDATMTPSNISSSDTQGDMMPNLK